jgi:hypothetical protein
MDIFLQVSGAQVPASCCLPPTAAGGGGGHGPIPAGEWRAGSRQLPWGAAGQVPVSCLGVQQGSFPPACLAMHSLDPARHAWARSCSTRGGAAAVRSTCAWRTRDRPPCPPCPRWLADCGRPGVHSRAQGDAPRSQDGKHLPQQRRHRDAGRLWHQQGDGGAQLPWQPPRPPPHPRLPRPYHVQLQHGDGHAPAPAPQHAPATLPPVCQYAAACALLCGASCAAWWHPPPGGTGRPAGPAAPPWAAAPLLAWTPGPATAAASAGISRQPCYHIAALQVLDRTDGCASTLTGTPYYMSPEVGAGQPADPSAHVAGTQSHAEGGGGGAGASCRIRWKHTAPTNRLPVAPPAAAAGVHQPALHPQV